MVAALLAVALVAAQPETQPVAAAAPRFVAVDVFVDSGPTPLAAYQVEFTGTTAAGGSVTLVGVEGGAHPALAAAPYYDPKALAGGHIIIAAFTTAADLPSGKTRVARLHLRVEGATPNYAATLVTAGDAAAKPIPATVSVGETP
jgi:hypothetical protein